MKDHRILCVILALCTLLSLVACGGETGKAGSLAATTAGDIDLTPEAVPLDLSGYLLIRPDDASDRVKNSAKAVSAAFSDAGAKISLLSDAKQEPVENEILIGATSRPESASALSSLLSDEAGNKWSISVIGKKVVLAGVDDLNVKYAAEAFINIYISKGAHTSFSSGTVLLSEEYIRGMLDFKWADGKRSVISTGAWGPRVYTMSNGELISGYETSKGIVTAISANNAKTWKSQTTASFHPSRACANVNFYEFEGKIYLSYRATGGPGKNYTSLQVSVSEDFGRTWKHHSTIAEYDEDGGVWEPCLGEIDGKLTVFYACDVRSITSRQNIESKTWDGSKWTKRTIISNGEKHNSRDGMPVWIRLSTGMYICVIESQKYAGSGHPFIIQYLTSEDGVKWSEPVDCYIPKTTNSKAGAPGIVELSTGQVVISFQTDEDATKKGDNTSVMKTITAKITDVTKLKVRNFTASDNVFNTPDGEGSVWSGIWYHDGFLYAAAGNREGASLNILDIG